MVIFTLHFEKTSSIFGSQFYKNIPNTKQIPVF